MNLTKIISNLRSAQQKIDEVLIVLERVAAATRRSAEVEFDVSARESTPATKQKA